MELLALLTLLVINKSTFTPEAPTLIVKLEVDTDVTEKLLFARASIFPGYIPLHLKRLYQAVPLIYEALQIYSYLLIFFGYSF